MKRSLLGCALAVALAAALGLSANLASAQDTGNGTDVQTEVDQVQVTAESTEVETGGTVEVHVAVLDANGAPLAGVECTFSLASQPGDDASVDAGPSVTDAAGNASTTLAVGSTAGTIVVEADCDGVAATVSVVAAETAAPPGALPDSGNGGYSVAGGRPVALISLLAALTVALAGVGVVTVARARGARAE